MYIYNATGVKLKKTVNVSITDYAGNYIYENDELQFFNHPEGYATLVNAADYDSGFDYVCQYKNHLGNIRLSYTDNNGDLEIVEENNYYPFGLKMRGFNTNVSSLGNSVAQKRKFGGNELQDELGLEWYDITARNYDPALGRWMNVDPLAEQMRRHSPYNYAFNNPIYFIDPDGRMPKVPGREGDLTAEWAPDDLILKGSGVKKAIKAINEELGGDFASVDKNGKVSLNVSRDDLKTDEQKGLFDVLSKPINSDNDTKIKVLESDGAVIAGDYNDGRIDIDDIVAFGKEDELMNQRTVLGHEINEQYEFQDVGVKDLEGADRYSNSEGTGVHDKSKKVESTMNGGWERGGSTITNQSKERVVKKQRIGTRSYTARSYKSSVKFTKNGKTRTSTYRVVKGNVVKRQ